MFSLNSAQLLASPPPRNHFVSSPLIKMEKQEADLSSCFLLFVVVYLSFVSLGVWLNSILLLFFTSVLVGYFDFVMLFYFVGSCCLFINIPVHARCKQRDSKSQIHHNERFHNKLSQYFMRPVPQSRIRSLAR